MYIIPVKKALGRRIRGRGDVIGIKHVLTPQAALHVACMFGRTELVKLLLERGSNVNVTTHDGDTALLLAASKNDLDVCAILLAQEGVSMRGLMILGYK